VEFEVTATVVFRVSYVNDPKSAVDRVHALLPRADGDLPESIRIVRIVAIRQPRREN